MPTSGRVFPHDGTPSRSVARSSKPSPPDARLFPDARRQFLVAVVFFADVPVALARVDVLDVAPQPVVVEHLPEDVLAALAAVFVLVEAVLAIMSPPCSFIIDRSPPLYSRYAAEGNGEKMERSRADC